MLRGGLRSCVVVALLLTMVSADSSSIGDPVREAVSNGTGSIDRSVAEALGCVDAVGGGSHGFVLRLGGRVDPGRASSQSLVLELGGWSSSSGSASGTRSSSSTAIASCSWKQRASTASHSCTFVRASSAASARSDILDLRSTFSASASSWRSACPWVRAIVSDVAWTVDQVTSETRPTCSRTIMASSIMRSTPTMSASTASFCARSTSSSFSSIVARSSVIFSMWPGLPTIASVTSGCLPVIRPNSRTALAESFVSFTHRPELPAVSEPVCRPAAPVPNAFLRRVSPSSFEGSPPPGEEVVDGCGFADDRQSVAVADQLDLIGHPPLLVRGRRSV